MRARPAAQHTFERLAVGARRLLPAAVSSRWPCRCRPCWVVCTAAYYMHQYYCIESMHSSDRFVRSPFFVSCSHLDDVSHTLQLYALLAVLS